MAPCWQIRYAEIMATALHTRSLGNVTPRDYHARRAGERLAKREAWRNQRLTAAREAIARLAPEHPGIEAVYLFGSILSAGRFTRRSDIDVAIDCQDLATESGFWRALEDALESDVDLRQRRGSIAAAVESSGETVYERTAVDPGA